MDIRHNTHYRRAPLLKFHQVALLAAYTVTVLTAFLYFTFGNPPKTYFSNKKNIFNKYFVKIGWFWVTVVYFSYVYLVRTKSLQRTNNLVNSLGRYVLITLYWYLLTQWFFGPSFIDRVYVLSGGSCVPILKDTTKLDIFTSVAEQRICRKLGGSWTGGHDVSGHCVLLIHASMFLWEELNWLFYDYRPLLTMKARSFLEYISVLAVVSLLGLWWFMLFMTGVYFHGHFEILSGTFFGILGWAIYYLGVFPRVPALGLPPSNP